MPRNWHPVVRGFHWLSAFILVLCALAVWGHEAFARGTPERAALMQMHFLAGGLLGVFALLRIAARLATPVPATAANSNRLLKILAKTGHLAIYGFMLVLPLLGYIAVSGKGAPIDMLGLVSLPPLTVDKELAHTAKELHEGLANVFLVVLAGHVTAVLYHARILHDDVLRAMLGKNQ